MAGSNLTIGLAGSILHLLLLSLSMIRLSSKATYVLMRLERSQRQRFPWTATRAAVKAPCLVLASSAELPPRLHEPVDLFKNH